MEKVQAAREYDLEPIFAVTSGSTENISHPSMARSTMEAYEIVSRLDRTGRIADYPNDKKQKAATTFLRDEIQK